MAGGRSFRSAGALSGRGSVPRGSLKILMMWRRERAPSTTSKVRITAAQPCGPLLLNERTSHAELGSVLTAKAE
jgi:hypothetical protein